MRKTTGFLLGYRGLYFSDQFHKYMQVRYTNIPPDRDASVSTLLSRPTVPGAARFGTAQTGTGLATEPTARLVEEHVPLRPAP